MPEEIVRTNWTASTNVHRALIIKAIFICVLGLAAVYTHGLLVALAVAYGGSVALLGSALVWYHMWRAERRRANDAQQSLRIVFRCAVERLLMTIILLALGFAVFRLHALGLLVGFISTQLLAFLDSLKNRV